MRIEIKTNGPVKDIDIKALYLIAEAMKISSSPKMQKANLNFFIDKYCAKNVE